MANANNFMNNYVNAIVQLIQALNQVQYMNAVLADDPTLPTRYFAQSGTMGPSPRADIAAGDVTAASSAIVQLLFAFNSGSPAQSSLLYKMLP